jgi:hypothetical protein
VKAVIIIFVVITTADFLRPLANCLPEISEPISDLSNIPVKTLGISADLSGVQEKLKSHTFQLQGRAPNVLQLWAWKFVCTAALKPQAGMAQGVSDVDARKWQKFHMELYFGETMISEENALP